jgi:flagellar hook-length control protein FliK
VGSDVTAGRSIGVAVSDPRWPSAVATQVQLMVSANAQNVTLRLSPEHLGPLEVHIDVQATQINVSFVAAHPETRSALEQTVPALRALLAQGGLTLGQAQVQGEAGSGSQSTAARTHRPTDEAVAQTPDTVRVMQSVGLIDEYA